MPSGLPRPYSPIVRALAGALALTLTTSVHAATTVAPLPSAGLQLRAGLSAPESEIERLYLEGQEKYGTSDFAAAAEAWTRLLDRLSEAQANKATRENVLLLILQADIDAYNRTRLADGRKDIEHLRSGKATLDEYYTAYRRAYGDLAAVSVAVQERGDELESLLQQAEADAAAVVVPKEPPDGGEEGDGDPKDPAEGTDGVVTPPPPSPPNTAGNGLLIGGAVAASVGVGMLGLGIAGAVLGPRAGKDFTAATTETDRDDAEERGKRANAMMISGLAASAVGLGLGGALIFLGIRKRNDAKAADRAVGIAPVLGPRFTGAVISARF